MDKIKIEEVKKWKFYIPIIGIYYCTKSLFSGDGNLPIDSYHYFLTAVVHAIYTSLIIFSLIC